LAPKVWVAECESCPGGAVAIKSMMPRVWEVRNQIRALGLLRSSGNVVGYLGSQVFVDRVFLFMEAADESLADYIDRRAASGDWPLALNESLPMLVDLLRGARDLGRASVVHGAISEENVLLKAGRPLLADFGCAAVLSADDDVGLGSFSFGARVSEFRFPPETIRGVPTGPSNHVWQLGALFGVLCLGHDPVMWAVLPQRPDLLSSDWEPEMDDAVQDIIRRGVPLRADRAFAELGDADAQRLLEGMLEVSTERRWSVEGALAEAEAVAARRGIALPAERGARE